MKARSVNDSREMKDWKLKNPSDNANTDSIQRKR